MGIIVNAFPLTLYFVHTDTIADSDGESEDEDEDESGESSGEDQTHEGDDESEDGSDSEGSDDDEEEEEQEEAIGFESKEQLTLFRSHLKIRVYGTDIPNPFKSFDGLAKQYQLEQYLQRNIAASGFKKPTPIQMQAIPVILHVCSQDTSDDGHDGETSWA